MRKCTKCKCDKSLTEFGRAKNGPDGLNYWCKECVRASAKKYYDGNSDTILTKHKSHYQANAERLKSDALARYHANAEIRRKQNKQWKLENSERVKSYQKAYVQANLDKYNCYNQNRRARMLSNGGSHTVEEWEMLCESFGNVCLCCGEEKKLTKDHIKPIKLGGTNYIWNIQPLCMDCNLKKGVNEIDFRRDFVL
jgi:5-methylcytosine-specific restriction endonuclease McrA